MAKKFENDIFEDNGAEIKTESDALLEQLKVGLIKLGLKGIEDLNSKRVQNPAQFYDSLTALYNAVKN
ncbi:MAG: hypothetical protein IJU91_10810 [Selenomonadaceae bacterium]|nr:hypothetical protein [Selenomonadaceae bacterium]